MYATMAKKKLLYVVVISVVKQNWSWEYEKQQLENSQWPPPLSKDKESISIQEKHMHPKD